MQLVCAGVGYGVVMGEQLTKDCGVAPAVSRGGSCCDGAMAAYFFCIFDQIIAIDFIISVLNPLR